MAIEMMNATRLFGMVGTESGFELAGCTTYTSESTAERLSDEELIILTRIPLLCLRV
jgi:hypothetical protein